MSNIEAKKKRGRPPKFNAEQALGAAMRVFWEKGLSNTSLDDLSEEMKMNRPSIYNAFGGKEAIYRAAMAQFAEQLGEHLQAALFGEVNLRSALEGFFGKALDIYLSGPKPLGCFVTCTTPVEAATSGNIQSDFFKLLHMIDGVLEKRLRQAQDAGELDARADVRAISKLCHATLQSLALRARSGETREELDRLYKASISFLLAGQS